MLVGSKKMVIFLNSRQRTQIRKNVKKYIGNVCVSLPAFAREKKREEKCACIAIFAISLLHIITHPGSDVHTHTRRAALTSVCC